MLSQAGRSNLKDDPESGMVVLGKLTLGKSSPRYIAASDHTLLVRFSREMSTEANDAALWLMRRVDRSPLEGIADVAPAYASLMVRFDPGLLAHLDVETYLRDLVAREGGEETTEPRILDVPVVYGGEYGPDLEATAALCRVSEERLVELHTSVSYRVYFLGFSPGFAYLGEVPEFIAAPRLSVPRREVPAGSVGIAGRQTGVYPNATPGGWRIIGRTPLRMFDAGRDPMSLVSPGDRVRFHAVGSAEFQS
jgi:KipI family sensor histidine kinase inhibitor